MHARTLEPLEGACYTQLTVIDSKIDVRKIQPLPTAAGVKWKHNRSIVAHTCFFHLHRDTEYFVPRSHNSGVKFVGVSNRTQAPSSSRGASAPFS